MYVLGKKTWVEELLDSVQKMEEETKKIGMVILSVLSSSQVWMMCQGCFRKKRNDEQDLQTPIVVIVVIKYKIIIRKKKVTVN